ncbi:5'-nucleotidase [Cryobacterium glaciale]|uniref:5'-nucleotidase n=1 Tax=Cryobacterium glaciale TaxID=1259145 RepID=A0A4R8V3E8_9MICO|nr:5'-nucleotidase [Cryobacterium glaciale]
MMAYVLTNRLVVGVASSALFDLSESDAIFRAEGEEPYRTYQDANIDTQLLPGVAFPFIQRLLGLNDLSPIGDPLVEVIVLSKNDPTTGLRVMRSIESHGLSITRAVFTQGKSPYEYIGAFEMSLFLSADERDVRKAVELGFPAGRVMPSDLSYAEDGGEVRVAFDFDGVLADDESERIFQGPGGLKGFQDHEVFNLDRSLSAGPLRELLKDLHMIQNLEKIKKLEQPQYQPRVRISIVTARNAPAHERAVRTLSAWGITVNDAFFLGGISKGSVLKVLRPHIFFDDQEGHLTATAEFVASVHVPYGIANESPQGTAISLDILETVA